MIIGISCYYHDSAASVVDSRTGEVLGCYHEERYTRVRHDKRFPVHGLKAMRDKLGLEPNDIEAVVFYEKPLKKFIRNVESIVSNAPNSFELFKGVMSSRSDGAGGFKKEIAKSLEKVWPGTKFADRIRYSEHHRSHAASAFYTSPFSDASIVTIDGVGEYDTTSIFHGEGSDITAIESIEFPNSLGIFYSAFTAFSGLRPNSGEYKFMGLAPYGLPIYENEIRDKVLMVDEDSGLFNLNLDAINPVLDLSRALVSLSDILDLKANKLDAKMGVDQANIASSVQKVLNDAVFAYCRRAQKITKSTNLALAGGVALNCVTNAHLYQSGLFEDVYVVPAAGDAGGALGAALLYYYGSKKRERAAKEFFSPYLGHDYSDTEIEEHLNTNGAVYRRYDDMGDLVETTATRLNGGQVCGWHQGRSEFGPRALGNRSILASATDPEQQRRLNIKTKFRESFRPFAPVVLEDDYDVYFEGKKFTPYMLFTHNVRENQKITLTSNNKASFEDIASEKRSTIPAVTHVDYSARVQSVSKHTNPLFAELLQSYKHLSGTSVLVNTSFNVRGEPIVDSPADAFRCFMATDLDFLVIGRYLLEKTEQTIDPTAFRQNFSAD